MAQMKSIARALALAGLLLNLSAAHAADEPRTIVGLYANHVDDFARDSRMFGAAELPLNYLGLVLEPYHVAEEIPDIAGRDDIRGVLIWLERDDLPVVDAVTDFVAQAVEQNIPVVIMEDLPENFAISPSGTPIVVGDGKRALSLIGVQDLGGYQSQTFDLKIAEQDSDLIGFERGFDGPLPPVGVYAGAANSVPGLVLERGDGTRTSPVLITEKGAFVAPGYAIWTRRNSDQARWYVNPFSLFSRVYKTDGLPRADPTTLSGRRIYFSHIDGDGWLNVTQVEGFTARRALSSEVILERAVIPYPDLPVTVAPVAGDLDPKFIGTERSQETARRFFALPNVEPGSHTYTHPFQWSYFAPGNYSPADELRYRDYYLETVLSEGYDATVANAKIVDLGEDYTAPRAYGDIPFNLNREIVDAAAYISTFSPPDKPVRLVQWSGDTAPFAEAIAAADQAGLLNINGGDTLRDDEYPSYLTVAPYGKLEGGYRQIYTGGSNENIYTEGWLTNFSGFRHVLATIANTDTPRRVAPANIYYHIYSGEREAALRAVTDALDGVSRMELAPIATSHYVEIANGFYTTRLERVSELSWRVHDRGALPTLRFDDAEGLNIDMPRSEGVLGARHVGDVLYVSLDSANDAPLVTLRRGAAQVTRPVLDNSRWEIWNLVSSGDVWSFTARGFGPGQMSWRTAPSQTWLIESAYGGATHAVDAQSDAEGVLSFSLPRGAENAVEIRMTRRAGSTP